MSMQERLTERFLRYAAVPSQSKEGCAVVPSTPGQWDMAKPVSYTHLTLPTTPYV